jgi:hypothetical protein
LIRSGASIDVAKRTPITTITESDVSGVSLTFTSKGIGDVSDLNKSGTGAVSIETSQGSASARETATVTFSDLVAGRTLTLGGVTYAAPDGGASANTVAKHFASRVDFTSWTTSPTQTQWYRLSASEVSSFDVVAPATTSQPLTLTVRSVVIDGTATAAVSSSAPLTIPFEDRPAAPSLTVLPGPSASEDQFFALSQFVTLNPGSGRSAETATLYIRATNANLTSDIQVVDGLGSSAGMLPTAQIGGHTFYIVKADSIATSYLKTSTTHFKTSINGPPIALEVFARDTASNNLTADSAKSTTNLKITALADGVSQDFVTPIGSVINQTDPNKKYDIDFAIGSDTHFKKLCLELSQKISSLPSC